MNRGRLNHLVFFAKHHLRSGDIDPAYSVLKLLTEPYDEDIRLWRLWLYTAYYHLGSALLAWKCHPEPEQVCDACAYLPTGTERRNLRGGKVARHIEDTMRQAGGDLPKFFSKHMEWNEFQERGREIWGNGRWAMYKFAEIAQKVAGWDLTPTDMGNAFSSGPRHGLDLFFYPLEGNSPDVIQELDRRGEVIQKFLADRDVHADIAQVETILCDFNSLTKGHYYVGHDIDQQIEQILFAEEKMGADKTEQVWWARKESFPTAYLGEERGWWEIDKERKRAYRDERRILVRR